MLHSVFFLPPCSSEVIRLLLLSLGIVFWRRMTLDASLCYWPQEDFFPNLELMRFLENLGLFLQLTSPLLSPLIIGPSLNCAPPGQGPRHSNINMVKRRLPQILQWLSEKNERKGQLPRTISSRDKEEKKRRERIINEIKGFLLSGAQWTIHKGGYGFSCGWIHWSKDLQCLSCPWVPTE